ncbi:MAG: hypothetical protein IKM29_02590 [Clostridia bacterium]|nr:hypothetical protein [Clostridia bacterium]
MKKILLILSAVLVLFTFAACGGNAPEETSASTTEATTLQTTLPASVENPITNIYMSCQLADGSFRQLEATPIPDGKTLITYVADIKKSAGMDSSALNFLTLALEETGLSEFNNVNTFSEGSAYASMYISFEDGTILSASFYGETLPEDFMAAYGKFEASFMELMKDIPEYVPAPNVYGTPDETVLSEMLAIFDATEITYPDAFCISEIEKDDIFGITAGLENTEGIVQGTQCYPMMSSSAFSMVIVTLEDGGDIEAVREDFMDDPQWNKWVCVSADGALVANKGNMVIFLMANQNSFDVFSSAIVECGWLDAETNLRPMPR